MLQAIGLLMCAYLCFKGVEIWMLGATAPKEHGWSPGWIGAFFMLAAIAVAGVFTWVFIALGATAGGLPGF